MAREDKDKQTDKQRRQEEDVKEGRKERGISEERGEKRAVATAGKNPGGGKQSGTGRGQSEDPESDKRTGRKGGSNA